MTIIIHYIYDLSNYLKLPSIPTKLIVTIKMFKKCNLTINCMGVYNLMFSRIISVTRKYPYIN